MLKLLALDCDGCLNTGRELITLEGKILANSWNIHDFSAIDLFKLKGIEVLFLSGNNHNKSIADYCNVKFYSGVVGDTIDKVEVAKTIFKDYKLESYDCFGYLGDDYLDLELLEFLKEEGSEYLWCPKNAVQGLDNYASRLNCNGGHGCVMEIYESIFPLNTYIDFKKLGKMELQ